MVQVPTATRATVPLVTVQTVGVDELKLTAKPELDVALKAKELLPKGSPGSGPKLMVWVGCLQAVAPAELVIPGGHAAQNATVVLPETGLYVPAGQAVFDDGLEQ
jgi:hypothetical protein